VDVHFERKSIDQVSCHVEKRVHAVKTRGGWMDGWMDGLGTEDKLLLLVINYVDPKMGHY